MAKPKVFLDSSVIITALLSTQGGSFYIIEYYKINFTFQINKYSLGRLKISWKLNFLASGAYKSAPNP